MTPLDVIKIRLQAQSRQLHKGDCFVFQNGLIDQWCTCFNGKQSWYNRKIPGSDRYKGSIDALVKIVRYEGITSLWSGLPPTLAMSFPMVVLYFTAYEESKKFFGYHEIHNPNPALPVLSGALSRLLAVTAVSPIELIRTKMQSEKLKYSQIGEKVKSSVENHGFRSLYRGLVPTIWRDIPFSMIYWFNLENMKIFFLRYRNETKLDVPTIFFCGAVSGGITAALTTPLDVIKTLKQVELGEINSKKAASQKTLFLIKQTYRDKGIKGLFAG
jgi:solute carrier family 25 protein 39/40